MTRKTTARATRRAGRPSRSAGHPYPPQIPSSIRFTHTFRFMAKDAPVQIDNGSTISANQLISILGVGSGLSGNGWRILRSVRIRKVEMWGMFSGTTSTNISENTPVSMYVEFPNSPNLGPGGPDIRYSDLSIGTARPGHIVCRPPPTSISGMWLNRNDAPVLTLRYPQNAILDLTLDCILEDGNLVASTGASGAIAGENYLWPIDLPSGYWVPVAYNTSV